MIFYITITYTKLKKNDNISFTNNIILSILYYIIKINI